MAPALTLAARAPWPRHAGDGGAGRRRPGPRPWQPGAPSPVAPAVVVLQALDALHERGGDVVGPGQWPLADHR
eukprot:4123033-Alexandrium_andersonii.AAC.1